MRSIGFTKAAKVGGRRQPVATSRRPAQARSTWRPYVTPKNWQRFFALPERYRRAKKAERALKRLEDKITFQHVKLDNGKTQTTREEPKDYSRIIATNLMAEVYLHKVKIDNLTRVFIACCTIFVALIYKLYLDDQKAEINEAFKEIETRETAIREDTSLLKELNQTNQLLNQAGVASERYVRDLCAHLFPEEENASGCVAAHERVKKQAMHEKLAIEEREEISLSRKSNFSFKK